MSNLLFKQSISLYETDVNTSNLELLTKLKQTPKNIIKIGFIGNSRAGKSTLINIFCSMLSGKSTNTFGTSRGKEQCTKGIQINIVETKDHYLVFTDYRGTNNGDASLDLFLTFFAYINSDIVILTEQKIIYNSTLQNGLGSSVTFINQIKELLDGDNGYSGKKHLVFRLQDFVDLDLSAQKMQKYIDDVLDCKDKDQYEQYRKAVLKLFNKSNIHCRPTLAPERKQLQQLNEKQDFYSILEDEESLFKSFCIDIMDIAYQIQKPKQTLHQYTLEFIKDINIVKGQNINDSKKIAAFNAYEMFNKNNLLQYLLGKQVDKQKLIIMRYENFNDVDEKIKAMSEFIKSFNKEFERVEDDFKMEILKETLQQFEQELQRNISFNICKTFTDNMQNIISQLQELMQQRVNKDNVLIFEQIKKQVVFTNYNKNRVDVFYRKIYTELYNQLLTKVNQAIQHDIDQKKKLDNKIQFLKNNQDEILQQIILSMFKKKEKKNNIQKKPWYNEFIELLDLKSNLNEDFDKEEFYKQVINHFDNQIQQVIQDYKYKYIGLKDYKLLIQQKDITLNITLSGIIIDNIIGEIQPIFQESNNSNSYFTNIKDKYIIETLKPQIQTYKNLYVKCKSEYLNTIQFESRQIHQKNPDIKFVSIINSGMRKHDPEFLEHKQFIEKSSLTVKDFDKFEPVESDSNFDICKNELVFYSVRENKDIQVTLNYLINRGFLKPTKICDNYYNLHYTELMDNLLFNNYTSLQLI